MKLTTGYDFQGYFITDYLDVVFDEMLVGLGLGKSIISGFDNAFSALLGSEATTMIDKLNQVKTELRGRVIKKAQRMGANALIGIDFESSKLGDLIMVSMTATAVKIDKIVSPLPYTLAEQKKDEEDKEKARVEEIRQRKLEEFNNHQSGFDKDFFVSYIRECKTVKEILAYIDEAAPGCFEQNVIDQIKSYTQLERMYGAGTGIKDVVRILEAYLGI